MSALSHGDMRKLIMAALVKIIKEHGGSMVFSQKEILVDSSLHMVVDENDEDKVTITVIPQTLNS